MVKTFMEALDEEIKKAEGSYSEVKRDIIGIINTEGNRNIHAFSDYGAAYATNIDKLTIYATKIKTLHEIKNIYEYFQKAEGENE